jgi:hypothetical protein
MYDGYYRFFHIFYYTFYEQQKKSIDYLKEKFPFFVLSLTTSPRRIEKMQPVIDSIMKQTILPNKIILNLPYVFKRDGSTYDVIPDFIKSNPLIQINRCEDIGPATKVIPTALLFDDLETIIISIDDDIIYPNTMIENLLDYSDDFPESTISGLCDKYTGFEYIDKLKKQVFYSANVCGFMGVLYKIKFLNNFNQEDLFSLGKSCYLADDLIISNHLFKNNIKIISIFPIPNIKDMPYGHSFDALNYGANNDSGNFFDNVKNMTFFYSSNTNNYIECSKELNNSNLLYVKNWL